MFPKKPTSFDSSFTSFLNSVSPDSSVILALKPLSPDSSCTFASLSKVFVSMFKVPAPPLISGSLRSTFSSTSLRAVLAELISSSV